jgi:superfamily I DNA and RNA helicase
MRMGEQIAQRQQLQPVLTQEQQRLMNLALDGKPRLVRGVAGSGKSLVLCHWLARTAQKLSTMPEKHIWAVYANRSLHTLLHETIESAWSRLHEGSLFDSREFPWQQVSLLHIKDVLAGILPNAALSMEQFGFDYDRASEVFLDREDWQSLLPSCHALFIDEAQDMGPSTLRLLLSMVEQANFSDPNSRSAHIFYDNAQNVYGTKTPTWSEFGLAMRGRSTILRDSYRSTLPITELAVNVLYRLLPNEAQREPRELLDLKLLRWTRRTEQPWLQVCFTQVSGPKPAFRTYPSREAEIESLAKHIRYLIDQEGIATKDICLIYNGKARSVLMRLLAPKLHEAGIELSIQTNRSFERRENQLLATTPQSFKGYEAEVVLIPCVDHFVASGGKILANSLYVAMTRARSLLAIYGMQGLSPVAHHLTETLAACIDALNSPDVID